jgi:hypothetical protein
VSTALKVNVLVVGTGVNDVSIDTLTAVLGVDVLVEGTEGEAVPVGDTSQAPWGVLLCDWFGILQGTNDLIPLDVLNIRMFPNLLQDDVVELAGIAEEAGADLIGMLEAVVGDIVVAEDGLSTSAQLRLARALSRCVNCLDP